MLHQIFTVPLSVKLGFETKLKELKKKAEKLNVVFEYNCSEPFEIKHPNPHIDEMIRVYDFHVSFQEIKIPGWKFLGKIEHLSELGNVLSLVPNSPKIPEEYRTINQKCDYCEQKRHRIKTFILQNESGEFKQIGSNCLKDFIGHNLNQLFGLSDIHYKISEFGDLLEEGFNSIPKMIETFEFLSYVASEIEQHGFISNKEAYNTGNMSTSDYVWFALTNPKEKKKLNKPQEKHEFLASQAIKWAQEITEEETKESEYLHNIKVLSNLELLESRHKGFVASIVSSYQRNQSKIIEQELFQKSEFFGEIKKRVKNITLQYHKTLVFDSIYGTTRFHFFFTEQYNLIVWKTGKGLYEYDLQPGKSIVADFTPKQHQKHNGINQTVVSRMKIE